uniref:WH1 domain-containing protein n=1 Tax=Clastoptera arizonana TaxID=38151 RepID=A0A1B6CJ86_9HEMI
MSEQSIASARASVMLYDDLQKKWIPSGSSSGLSKVHIFQHQGNNSFRVVGRKLQDHEVVINCAILKGLKYNQATHTFHQWRDNKHVYGLNFSNKEDADLFARAMLHALDILSNTVTRPSVPPPAPVLPTAGPQQPVYQQTNGQYEEDMGYRTMTREDVAILQERRMSQQSQVLSSPSASSPSSTGPPQMPATPPGNQGHHRTSSAPPAPQPPPMTLAPASCPPPPVPPLPPPCPATWNSTPSPAAPGPPPPPPPPGPNMSRSSSSDGPDMGSLAAQLQNARLRRSNKQSAENSGSSTSSSGSNYGTLGRGQSGMASMMDEMAKTLARRRAQAEKKDPADFPVQEGDSSTIERKGSIWNTGNKLGNGCESSPKPTRKQLNSSSEECIPKVNGEQNIGLTLSEQEAFKQDIIREMKKELNKIKQDILDAIKVELNKR